MPKSFSELEPKWDDAGKHIEFLCPTCERGDTRYSGCIIVLPVGGNNGWTLESDADFEKMTLSPSIWHHCKTNPHFFVRNGEVVMA